MFNSFWNGVTAVGKFFASLLLLVIRLFWGYQLVITGFGKFLALGGVAAYFQSLGIPAPYLNAVLVASIELLGGALLFLGLWSRIACLPLIGVFVVAYLTGGHDTLVALKNGNSDPFLSYTAFLFLYTVLIVFCFGPGKLSFDYWVRGSNKTKEMP